MRTMAKAWLMILCIGGTSAVAPELASAGVGRSTSILRRRSPGWTRSRPMGVGPGMAPCGALWTCDRRDLIEQMRSLHELVASTL